MSESIEIPEAIIEKEVIKRKVGRPRKTIEEKKQRQKEYYQQNKDRIIEYNINRYHETKNTKSEFKKLYEAYQKGNIVIVHKEEIC